MFYVNGTNIKFTRGDSATLSVALDGYEMQDGDALTLSCKVDNSTSTGTINGTYVLDVYGVKLQSYF